MTAWTLPIITAAAIYSSWGRLDIFAVAAISFIAAVLGDNVGYWIGVRGGRVTVGIWFARLRDRRTRIGVGTLLGADLFHEEHAQPQHAQKHGVKNPFSLHA